MSSPREWGCFERPAKAWIERRNKMLTQKIEGRIPTKAELLEDYKTNPEEFDPDAWYLCISATFSGLFIFLRPSDGNWSTSTYTDNTYVRYVR